MLRYMADSGAGSEKALTYPQGWSVEQHWFPKETPDTDIQRKKKGETVKTNHTDV